ncbi:MAG: hypothetical protein MAG431_00781 [Chloroflexi bacterium]|nr:hypothetical protein [Chloroflexota bacterium]
MDLSITFTFLVGVLVGWLNEWILDWFYWRNKIPSTSGKEYQKKLDAANQEIAELKKKLSASGGQQ